MNRKLISVFAVMLFVISSVAVCIPSSEASDVQYHSVTFCDIDGSIIKRINVADGTDAIPPAAPNHDGMAFISWDKNYTYVKEDLIIRPIYTAIEESYSYLSNPDTAYGLAGAHFKQIIDVKELFNSSQYEDSFNRVKAISSTMTTPDNTVYDVATVGHDIYGNQTETLGGMTITNRGQYIDVEFTPDQVGFYTVNMHVTFVANRDFFGMTVGESDNASDIVFKIRVSQSTRQVTVTFMADDTVVSTVVKEQYTALAPEDYPSMDEVPKKDMHEAVGWNTEGIDVSSIKSNTTIYVIYRLVGKITFENTRTDADGNQYYSVNVPANQSFNTSADESRTYIETNPAAATITIDTPSLIEGLVHLGRDSKGYFIYSNNFSVTSPGTYSIAVNAEYTVDSSKSIYGLTHFVIVVPIIITKPVEQICYVGDSMRYTPATEPSDDVVSSLVSVTKDGIAVSDTSFITTNGKSLEITWAETGTFTITYKITDTRGRYAPVNDTVTFDVREPTEKSSYLSLSAIDCSPVAGYDNKFYFTAIGASNNSCEWSFGDGETERNRFNTVHTFEPGLYKVTFTVYLDDYSDSISKSVYVFVQSDERRESAYVGEPYKLDITVSSGYDSSNDEIPSWMTVSVETADGMKYVKLRGLPTVDMVEQTYTVKVDGQSWMVTVYPASQQRPIASFDIDRQGLTVYVIYKGQYANEAKIDYGDGEGARKVFDLTYGAILEGKTYDVADQYRITLTVSNSKGEDSYYRDVTVSNIEVPLSIGKIVNQTCIIEKSFELRLDVSEGASVTVKGADWLTYDTADMTLKGTPARAGIYTVTVTATDGVRSVEQEFQILVRDNGGGSDNDNTDDGDKGNFFTEHIRQIIAGVVIAVAGFIALFYPDPRGKAVAAIVIIVAVIGGFIL